MFDQCSDWEVIAQQLMQEVSSQFLRTSLCAISTGQPHHTGSDADYSLAEKFCSQWRSWGIPKVHTQEFFVTIPLEPAPNQWNEVELIDLATESVIHKAQNFVVAHVHTENCSPGDSNHTEDVFLPAYQAFSTSGNASGLFVFVNYARPQDLVAFDRAQGRAEGQPSLLCSPNLIAIARLACGTRQSKLHALLNHCNCGSGGHPISGHHPAALILYPDPQDCVPPSQATYPHGPGLPGDAPVFGHVCMSSVGGGNPNTPFLPSSEHVYEEDAMVPGSALTPIPTQPVGYDDASVFLDHLSGPSVPDQWNGCLARKIGPSNGCVLKVTVRNRVSPTRVRCVNVLGVIPGDETTGEADQYVILGNHRDAWVQGACDPGSGTVLLQQIAKILGHAYTQGFRPRRTVILASWDGEELSLLGSTHFTEALHTELMQRAVAYINTDCPVKGHTRFNARTDPLLADALLRVSRLVRIDPPVDMRTLFDEWLAQDEPGKEEPTVSPPGGGSDHIPFAYKLGIPSSYPEYVPDNAMYNMPMYHTAYDTFDVVERYVDPPSGLTGPLPRHGVMARLLIAYLIHLACATRLPYSPKRLAASLHAEWDWLMQWARRKTPDLLDLGVHLDWITEDLAQFSTAVNTFELLVNQWEQCLEKFPTQLNRILAGLPQQFVMHSPTMAGHSPFGNVLLGPTGYRSTAYPHVHAALDRFFKQPSNENLIALKRALSILTTCLHRATGWLNNGLLGLDSLRPKSFDQ